MTKVRTGLGNWGEGADERREWSWRLGSHRAGGACAVRGVQGRHVGQRWGEGRRDGHMALRSVGLGADRGRPVQGGTHRVAGEVGEEQGLRSGRIGVANKAGVCMLSRY